MSFRKNKDKKHSVYRLTMGDRFLYGLLGGSIAGLVILVFYRSLPLAGIIFLLAFILYPVWKRKDIFEKRKRMITLEFKESLYPLSAALRAGESLESAFASTVFEMRAEYYPYLSVEWRKILSQMQLHRRIEDLLMEFAEETDIDEILSFAEILAVSKRTQGDLARIIDHTSRLLQEKIEMSQELDVLLAKKKTEQKIMNLMPLLVIAMLTTLAPDYVAPLYQTMRGRIVMTVGILFAGVSMLAARKIADIRL